MAALAIVKAVGLTYPAPQLVALRAGVDLLILAPRIWRRRAAFHGLPDRHLHALRVALSAVARLPLALHAAIGFTRPMVLMAMAALLLGEVVPRRRWLAAAVALGGAAVATGPPDGAWDPGLPAAGVVVLAGTGAIVATRRLRAAPPVVLMAFYVALLVRVPVDPGDGSVLLAIGAPSHAAPLCFLLAHARADAAVLGVLGYLSPPLTVAVGALVFGEVPGRRFAVGATLVPAAAIAVSRPRRPIEPR